MMGVGLGELTYHAYGGFKCIHTHVYTCDGVFDCNESSMDEMSAVWEDWYGVH